MQTLRTRGLSHHRHCITCGYDLTGLPNLKCPECGKSFDRDLPIVQAPRYSVDWRLLGFVYLALIAVVAYATFTDYDELPLWLTLCNGRRRMLSRAHCCGFNRSPSGIVKMGNCITLVCSGGFCHFPVSCFSETLSHNYDFLLF